MKRKVFAYILYVALLACVLVGCGNKNDKNQNSSSGEISVVSREDGSGTRGAFVELFGIEEKDADKNKIDNTTESAEITNSTSVVMITIAGNKNAIGYISLGSLGNSVKALKIDGATPSVENVKNKSYKIFRNFNIATKKRISKTTQDFINYIMSDKGQSIIEKEGYVSVNGDSPEYNSANVSGKITVSGSSSVTPVMEKIKESYCAFNKNVTVELQQSDSSTGIADVINGVSDIGMASRELESEESSTLTSKVIAYDGLAVIVNNKNALFELSSEQVKNIFTGKVTDWSELN